MTDVAKTYETRKRTNTEHDSYNNAKATFKQSSCRYSMWLMMISRTHPPAKQRKSASTAAGLTVSVSAGLHHELQAQHLQVHLAALGPDARLLHCLRHCHAEDVPVGSSPVPSSVPHCVCKILSKFCKLLINFWIKRNS